MTDLEHAARKLGGEVKLTEEGAAYLPIYLAGRSRVVIGYADAVEVPEDMHGPAYQVAYQEWASNGTILADTTLAVVSPNILIPVAATIIQAIKEAHE